MADVDMIGRYDMVLEVCVLVCQPNAVGAVGSPTPEVPATVT